jgi:hypothetical protein
MSTQAEAGKGSAPRKAQDQKSYSENYDRIFGGNSWLERKKREEAQLAATIDENERLEMLRIL